mgnify:CR=1 FL=1
MGERYWYTCAVCHYWYCWFKRPIAPFQRYCRECKRETPWETFMQGETSPPTAASGRHDERTGEKTK